MNKMARTLNKGRNMPSELAFWSPLLHLLVLVLCVQGTGGRKMSETQDGDGHETTHTEHAHAHHPSSHMHHHMDPSVMIFFTLEDLKEGKTMAMNKMARTFNKGRNMASGLALWSPLLHLLVLVMCVQGTGGRKMSETQDGDGHETTHTEHAHAHHPSSHMHHQMDTSVMIFFTLEDLKEGKTMAIYFPKSNPSKSPHLLPREEADQIPFSSKQLLHLLHFFSFSQDSPQAKAMEGTLRDCEIEPIKGEIKSCATSLESMLDFTRGVFGVDTPFSMNKMARTLNKGRNMASGLALWSPLLHLLVLVLCVQGTGGRKMSETQDGDGHETTHTEHAHAHHPSSHMHHHMDPSVMIFFTLEDLKEGKTMAIYFPKRNPSKSPHLLPREEADQIPFSSKQLLHLLHFFSFSQDSSQAKAMEDTLRECEIEPIKGEIKSCATSLESMLDFTRGVFGHAFELIELNIENGAAFLDQVSKLQGRALKS
ncbi:hypothetical protein ACE6H2_027044 [Prunus campanulata]